MYSSDDPRAKLAGGTRSAQGGLALRFAPAEYVKFFDHPPAEDGSTRYARGQNFVVGYTQATAGAVLARAE